MQSPRSSRARGLSSAPALPALGGGAEAASPLPASTFSSASADATAPASPRASFKARAPSQVCYLFKYSKQVPASVHEPSGRACMSMLM